ncbi:M20/M25/M40 family metallo-hydrolase [Altererythrobacter arenosus]|uniref:M20/M25/M40 family metallo-hydrolase n=1 Tax=Altererythrobacter arenosus TaxID=3032592 RepID=A0ABY8FTE9_9SPHN|nr:M20/M25/M40 family metallo-hydrolase [Altererythrobacter sp. CAU 1644]WFL78296.1 M20/M25/M40 family metallo-hydrolase [Altererythrobacter sp. CAU 1644]
MKLKAFLLAGVLAVAGQAVAQDSSPRALTAHEQRMRDIYRDIIAFRTAKGHDQVDEMVAYLTGRLSEAGFANEDLMVTDYDSEGTPTQGLVVRYRGNGSSGEKPIVLLAHMDVVDALPEDWVRDPFTLTEEGGYFYGRGTMDNKYGVANLTGTFIRLKEEGWTPNRDLYLVFSGDEETGMISTRAQAKWVAENVDPAFILNSDAGGIGLDDEFQPLAQRVQAAEKTFATWELTITNPGGHSSRPRTDNAIYELSEAVLKIRDHEFPVQATPLTRSYFGALGQAVPGPLGVAMRTFAADPTDADAIATLQANPETKGSLSTTCVATMLRGGHAENALPQSATATVNCRIFPGIGAAATEATLREVTGNNDIAFKLMTNVTESPESTLRDDVRAALEKSLAQRFGRPIPILPYMESGGTDGMHYRTLGYDTVAISAGSSRPQDMFAHGLNERMRVDAYYGGLDHWTIILKELAGG